MNTAAIQVQAPPGRGRLVDIRRKALLIAQLRVLLVGLAFAGLAAAALLRIGWLGLVQPAPTERSMADALLPPRGEITDRNGVPLARAFPAYALWYNPQAMDDGGPPLVRPPAEVAAELKRIFPDLDEYAVARQLASGRPGYLRRRVLPADANKVYAIGELALELPRETDRHYPQGSLAAHVLGYVEDGVGRVGMEAALDDRLRDPARRGEPVALSIDARVQGALEDELRRGMLSVSAVGAAGIVLDVDTGEVMALVAGRHGGPEVRAELERLAGPGARVLHQVVPGRDTGDMLADGHAAFVAVHLRAALARAFPTRPGTDDTAEDVTRPA